MFNPQNYKKNMKECIRKKVKQFLKETKLKPNDKYTMYYQDKELIVLQDEYFLKIFLINGKAYKEQINVYPIFSINEIKEVLNESI